MYLWIKALHIIAVISWMAGILYLYRLFIYHVERGTSSVDCHDMLQVMEHRLYRYITIPAMLVAWFAGISMLAMNATLMQSPWFHVKAGLVVVLTVVTTYAKRIHIQFKEKREPYPSSRQLRIWNEVPTVLMIIIVIMVIVRPF